MPKKIVISLFFITLIFSTRICLGYEEPQTIDVTKPTGGTTYYVDAAAGPGGDGLSEATAWDDIKDADGNVGPGDIVRIKAGTYPAFWWEGSSGTAGNEIVIEAYGDGDVYIEGNTGLTAVYLIIDGGPDKQITFRRESGDTVIVQFLGDYITLRRLIVQGPSGDCMHTNNGGIIVGSPTWQGSTTDFFEILSPRIYNVTIKDCNHKGVYWHAAKDGELRNSIFDHNESVVIQLNPRGGHYIDGLTISGNAIYNNNYGSCGGEAILISGQTSAQGADPWIWNTTISNNFFWDIDDNGMKIDSRFIGSNGGGVNNLKIYNNTFYQMDLYGIRVNSSTSDNQVDIKNNLFYNNGSGGIHVHSAVTGVTQSNNFTDDPSFLSTNQDDSGFLKLRTNSGAMNQGFDLSAQGIDNDYFGTPRPKYGGYDIGAHEYTVEPPQNLSIISMD